MLTLMGDWSSLEKVLTGASVALSLSVYINWKLWSRYTLVADRYDKFKEEMVMKVVTAIEGNTATLRALLDRSPK